MKLTKKKLQALVNASFQKHSANIMIDIFDIGKIFKVGEDAVLEGKDLDAEIIEAIELYRFKG
jgi:hypothetical protein